MIAPLATWIDGEAATMVSATDRGLQYGDGVFETMMCRAGRIRFLALHLERLQLGLQRLQIQFADHQQLRLELEQLAERAPPDALIKVIVTRGDAVARGYAPAGTERARRIVTVWANSALEPAIRERGVAVRYASLRLGRNPVLAGIKHLNRLEVVLARAESNDPAIFEALLLDSAGGIVSGTMSNVFMLKGQTLMTPPVEQCGVAGIIRAVVLREAATIGLRTQVTALGPDDLQKHEGGLSDE